MPVKRFKKIISNLHASDNKKAVPRNEPGFDKLQKVSPLIAHFEKKFQEEYSDSSVQSIDEIMVKFKGRSTMKQYMPGKPVKRSCKIWARSDASNGYLYKFEKGQTYQHWRTCFLGQDIRSEIHRSPSELSTSQHRRSSSNKYPSFRAYYYVINAYHPDTTPIDTVFLQDLASTTAETKILFGDINAKSPSWGKNLLDATGKPIEDRNLTILNTGEITFVSKTNGTASALDITAISYLSAEKTR
ncbi:piggyBac transposable element-derived protein 4 [Caerostris darwini]|uniref:PiggyBac transposable element-derived protein 4 n=1 Tax=Caerostris darwini TaxID=1538125 RepID=A0AAV4QAV1_9ARAC|nr:piggyBac transposable element-derived protein 4 [Caerostris darwini]